MNIFYLNHDPKQCAREHVDKHCVKMILEYAQLLSTAHRLLDGVQTIGLSKSGRKQKVWALSDSRDSLFYKATHVNHPSAVWARASRDNYIWLHSLLKELCHEYTYRYEKTHKVQSSGLMDSLASPPAHIRSGAFVHPTPAMPGHYIVPGDSIASYHRYYLGSKTHMFKWKNRENPSWIE